MTGAELQWKQDQILLRYRQLVDKKWIDGLSPQEGARTSSRQNSRFTEEK